MKKAAKMAASPSDICPEIRRRPAAAPDVTCPVSCPVGRDLPGSQTLPSTRPIGRTILWRALLRPRAGAGEPVHPFSGEGKTWPQSPVPKCWTQEYRIHGSSRYQTSGATRHRAQLPSPTASATPVYPQYAYTTLIQPSLRGCPPALRSLLRLARASH